MNSHVLFDAGQAKVRSGMVGSLRLSKRRSGKYGGGLGKRERVLGGPQGRSTAEGGYVLPTWIGAGWGGRGGGGVWCCVVWMVPGSC